MRQTQMTPKPPIGIMPRLIWLEKLEVPNWPSDVELAERKDQVKAAIDRYIKAGYQPLPAWYHELN